MYVVNTYRLDNSGLKISYTTGTQTQRVELNPQQASKLMEDLKLKHDRWAWEEVVKIFAIDTRLPTIIVAYYSKSNALPHGSTGIKT